MELEQIQYQIQILEKMSYQVCVLDNIAPDTPEIKSMYHNLMTYLERLREEKENKTQE